MKTVDLICLGAAVSVLAGFFAIKRIPLYAAYLVIVLACSAWFLILFPLRTNPVEGVFIILGVVLNGFGLAMVRVMLRRSVSLSMLARCDTESPAAFQDGDYASRVKDLEKYRLATSMGEMYRLTSFGRLAARVTAFFLGD